MDKNIVPASRNITSSSSNSLLKWKRPAGALLLVHNTPIQLNLTKGFSVNQTSTTSASLPPLPVPPLGQTVEKFLNFVKPIQTTAEYEQIFQLANKFLEEAGPLQRLLEQRAHKLPNWLTPWWLSAAYLSGRTPLPVITSPGVTFPPFNYTGIDQQINYAAKIVQAALKFHHLVLRNELTGDRGSHGIPFDMSQYKFLFGTVRIPRRNQDEIRYGKDQPQWAQHILVTRNGHTFKMAVYSENCHQLGLDQLQQQLRLIIEISDGQPPNTEEAVNIVSSDDRDHWADVYARLKGNNHDQVEAVENALFVVALDRDFGQDNGCPEDRNMEMALHGGGAELNARNRWYDKTLQFCVNENGYCGMTYEHTPAEGPPLARLLDFICDEIAGNNLSQTCNGSYPNAEQLHFKLDSQDREAIKKSEEKLDRVVKNLEVRSLAFDDFGKNVPKRAQLSPDSCIQVALQLAYFRLHRAHAPAYETGTLRKFHQGRTDTIRLPTMESVHFVEAMSRIPRPLTENVLFTLLESAVARHKKYSVEVMNGMGIDRHLLGLRMIAAENAHPVPQLLTSAAYQKLMHFLLSTSQVPTKHVLPMGFGPSAPDCYGVCYNPQENRIFFTITAYHECEETSAEKFAQELRKAFLDIRDLCDKAGRLKDRAKL